MGMIYYDANTSRWKDKCGCAGGDKPYNPPVNSTPMVYLGSTTAQIMGKVTNRWYVLKPNMLAVDVDMRDATEFQNTGIGTIPNNIQYKSYTAYISRVGGWQ